MIAPSLSRNGAVAVREDSLAGFRRITLENGQVSMAFLPELGGKMISLKRLASGREFLLQPPESGRGYRRPSYGDRFEEYDCSGFDECAPTVAACQHEGRSLPDHGELWSTAWAAELKKDSLHLVASGRALPFRLSRRVTLHAESVQIAYELRNVGQREFELLWSAHPLLAAEPGAVIHLPGEVRKLLVNWSKDDHLGRPGEPCDWPVATTKKGNERLDILRPRSVGHADKLFTGKLREGWCGLHFPAGNESLTVHFSAEDVPYLGLWICQGGWPTSRIEKHYTVALEPCSGRPDSLAEAAARGECQRLEPGAVRHWTLWFAVRQGPPSKLLREGC